LKSQASRSVPALQVTPPIDPTQTVTIAICTCNRPTDLRICLQAISRLDPGPSEVLVVDNSAGDPATKAAALEFGARYIVEPTPGLSRARNRALAESNCEFIAFVDDDAIPYAQWLSHLIEPFADPKIAAVTGETYDAESLPHSSAADKSIRILRNTDPLWFERANFGGLGYGTNMVLRKSACTEPQVFDERLGRGTPLWTAEESHAFAKLVARGYYAAHVPSAIVLHPSKEKDIDREAATAFAYWVLLFFEFPGHKGDLLRFLLRRLRRKRLPWPRDPQEPGVIMNSGWRTQFKAVISGTLLYFRNRKLPVR
jgi:cellulose synthase/poly-beta-1,6-N-acetylglucosamine synthase-like glycosyltransferase